MIKHKEIAILMIFLMVLVPFNGTTSAQEDGETEPDPSTPLFPIDYAQDTFTPKAFDDAAYYTVSDTYMGSVYYTGNQGTLYHTNPGMNGFSSFNGGDIYSYEDEISSSYRSSDVLTDAIPENDVYEDDEVGQAVQSTPGVGDEFTARQQVPIDLINDHSTTISNSGWTTFLTNNDTEAMLLDIEHSGSVYVEAPKFGYSGMGVCDVASIPMFRFNTTNTNQLPVAIGSSSSSPVTVTPHFLSNSSYFGSATSVSANSTYGFNLRQGNLNVTGPVDDDRHVFDVREFEFSLEEGNSYYYGHSEHDNLGRSFVNDLDLCSDTYALDSLEQEYVEHVDYETYTDPITGNSVVYAMNDMEVDYYHVAQGLMDRDVNVYFQQYPGDRRFDDPMGTITPNAINTMYENTYYQFNLSSDALLAVNATSDFFKIYTQDEFGDWDYFTSHSSESGNLYGDFFGDLNDADFVFLPQDTYYLQSNNLNAPDNEYFVSIVEIDDIGTGKTVTMNKGELKAFSYNAPVNSYNLLNLTHADSNNDLAVNYNYAYFEPRTGSQFDSTFSDFGNYSTSVSNKNHTIFREDYTFTPWDGHKVHLFNPFSGYNSTSDLQDDFTHNVEITLDSRTNGIMDDAFSSINYQRESAQSAGTFNVRIEGHDTENDVELIQPLNLAANSMYNISVSLDGNYTNTNYNGSIASNSGNDFRVYSGNSGSSDVFGEWWINTTDYQSAYQTIFTLADTSYLFLDLQRSFSGEYLNFTVTVTVEDLGVPELSFDMQDFLYDGTPTAGHVANQTDFAMEWARFVAPETGGGFLPFSAPVVIVGSLFVATFMIRRVRKRN